MEHVDVEHARTHLAALLSEVERGAQITICRDGRPVALLSPAVPVPGRELGFVPYDVPDTFGEPLPEAELAAWDGGKV